jgi:hypothetical protein
MENYPLKNWIPHRMIYFDKQILFEWLYLADKTFTEPFFFQTTFSCQSFAENKKEFKSVSTFEGLINESENVPLIEPTAFIFHISRCGSTLLTQMLSLDEKNIVVSEAKILDAVLQNLVVNDSENAENIVKAVIKLLGKKRFGDETDFFVKLDSWHILIYEKLRRMYPKTPFIFTFRQPDEVIRSQTISMGIMVPHELLLAQKLDFEFPQILMLEPHIHIAKVLEKYFENYLKIIETDKNTLFLDYKNGALPNLVKTEKFLRLSIDEETKQKMSDRSNFHSKNPNAVFKEANLEDELPEYQQKAYNLYNTVLEKLS